MKTFYYIAIIATIMVGWLQIDYLKALHRLYLEETEEKMEYDFLVAIDLELNKRIRKGKREMPFEKKKVHIKRLEDMSPRERDSLLRITQKGDTINLKDAMEKGVGKTMGEIFGQVAQDNAYRVGKPINLCTLDSFYSSVARVNFPHRILIYDKQGRVVAQQGELEEKPNHVSRNFPIGTKGERWIKVESRIPIMHFLTHQHWGIILSIALIIIILLCISCLLLAIRRKHLLLKSRETTINGIIHDLKSPIANSISLLSWFRTNEPDITKKSLLVSCEDALRGLMRHIESLLVVVRGEHARIALEKKDVDMYALAQRIKAEIDIAFADKSHAITIENRLPSSSVVYADCVYIENVMRNLLENSLKYSDEGVHVEIAIYEKDEKMYVSVKDDGWGIPRKDIKFVFRQYYRVTRKDKDDRKGYGIGLCQARCVINAHEGDIKVTSNEGEGSRFTFYLPLKS